jgi:nucleotide-binding universal stress UspA family protein
VNGIVVGVDESSAAQQALRWASAYGRLRQQPVTALMAWDYIEQRHAERDAPFDPHYSPERAEQALHKIVERALGPDRGVATAAVLDKPEIALQAASQTADLLVVGARGLGGFRGLLLGSVSRYMLHHSVCPVAVVRGEDRHPVGPVIVGLNGSEHSQRALHWAAAFAAAAGRRLIAVWAWHVQVVGGPFHPVALDYQSVAHDAAEALRQAVDDAHIDGVEVEQRSVLGQPAAELLNAAANEQASLVVVGARGLRGLTGALLGSVSDQVVHHATIPVVVVP